MDNGMETMAQAKAGESITDEAGRTWKVLSWQNRSMAGVKGELTTIDAQIGEEVLVPMIGASLRLESKKQ